MTEPLSRDAQALLDAARGGDEPGAADHDRVRAKVMAAVGAGAIASGAAKSGGIGASKIGLALVIAGVIAGAAYLALRSPDGDGGRRESPAVEPAPAPEPEPAPVATAEAEPEPEPEIDEPPPLPKKKPARPAADTLAAERALLSKANAALRAGDADTALAAVEEHGRQFPKGVLVEEVAATRVRALCAAGRTGEGMNARDRFLDRWPSSVHAPRVQAACR